jgi:hypothetical protein
VDALHGSSLPDPITAASQVMNVHVVSDGSVQGSGFTATFSCAAAESGRRRVAENVDREWGGTAYTSSRRRVAETADEHSTMVDAIEMSNAEGKNRPALPFCCGAGPALTLSCPLPAFVFDSTAVTSDGTVGAFKFLIPLDFDENTVDLNITALANTLWTDTMTRKIDVKFAACEPSIGSSALPLTTCSMLCPA